VLLAIISWLLAHNLLMSYMDKKDFSILYNGRRTDCVSMGDTYLVQITYKPFYLERHNDDDGTEHWLEKDSHRETELSRELGRLIREQHLD